MKMKNPKPEDIPALRKLWKEAFHDEDAFLDAFFSTGFSAARCRCIMEEGNALSALYWFDCTLKDAKYAYLYAVATTECHRGKGLCRALMADTHTHLTQQGYAGAVLVPGEESLFRFYEAMGYRVCGSVSSIAVSAPGIAPDVHLTELTVSQYATARRALLPEGGLIQEGSNLSFLRTYARFYGSDSWVLAGSTQNGIFTGFEFLGDTSGLPAITAAFGCREGRFRTPGNGQDFAMFLPLADNIPIPKYFGLAFD